MAAKERRVDAYIDNAADFAKPILRHLRKVVHAACPDVEETLKWGTPSFEYGGMQWISEGKPRNWKYMR